MTLGELNARITAFDDCAMMLLDVYLENISRMSPECEAMYDILRDKIRKARGSAWDEFSGRINEMSEQFQKRNAG